MPAAIQWTEEIVKACEDGILAGISIAQICENIGVSEASFYRHRLEDAAFESTIARVQEMAQEREVDQMRQLADVATEENYNAQKLKIWTRMWIAGKRKAKKYGDRLEHSGPGGGAIQIVTSVPQRTEEE